MSTPQVVVPGEDEREAVARVIAASINVPLERTVARSLLWHLEDLRVARVDGHVAAVAGEVAFHQWFGGRPVDCSGIWGVGTLPEHRGLGLASAVTGRLLDDARARGDAIASLYPAVLPPYRRLGFEIAGTYLQHRVELDAIPRPRAGASPAQVEVATPEEGVGAIRELVARWAADHNGPTAPRADDWWLERWLTHPQDPMFRAVVVRGDDGLEGFATVTREPTAGPLGDVSFGLSCEPLIATTERALLGLFEYFRAHRGIGRWVRWSAPPRDPVALLLSEAQPTTAMRYFWMLRILDVPTAFAARGYEGPDGEVTFAVEDPRYPENTGPWRLEVRSGSARVERADADVRPIPIGPLSAMFSGFLGPADAVALGIVDPADHAVPALTSLLAGPEPWNPWWF